MLPDMLVDVLAELRIPGFHAEVPLTRSYNLREFKLALEDLNTQIGKSKNLSQYLPIRIITAGGFVSLSSLGNRDWTTDLDYILDPHLSGIEKVKEKLEIAKNKASKRLFMNPHWFNPTTSLFILGGSRETLFEETIEQDVVLWGSSNLVVYACRWEWQLTMKFRRYNYNRPRLDDICDAVFLLDKIIEQHGRPVTKDEIRSWYPSLWYPLTDHFLNQFRGMYHEVFLRDGIR